MRTFFLFCVCSLLASPCFSLTEQLNDHPLVELMNKIQQSPHSESCDSANQEKIKEIVQAVDAQQSQVTSFSKSDRSKDARFERVSFGDGFLLRYVGPEKKSDETQQTQMSWDSLYTEYLKIKDDTDFKNLATAQAWMLLEKKTKALLSADEDRLIDRVNLGLTEKTEPALEWLAGVLNACVNDPTCIAPDFDGPLFSMVQSVPIYQKYLDLLQSGKMEPHHAIQSFLSRVLSDWGTRYRFVKNATIGAAKATDGTLVYALPLNGAALTESQRQLIQTTIEKVWSSPTARVEVKWIAETSPEIYKIEWNSSVRGGAYTMRGPEKAVFLFQENAVQSIAHETGHVLGFKEHYYVGWNENTCVYTTDFNTADVMSLSLYGAGATEEEWSTLSKNYPARSTLH